MSYLICLADSPDAWGLFRRTSTSTSTIGPSGC